MDRVFPAPEYREHPGLRALTERGLPVIWRLTDSPVLRTWYDFSVMARVEPLLDLRATSERAVVIGAQWVEIKTMSVTESQDQIVCGCQTGEIWRSVNYPRPSGHQVFINSSVELFEAFLQAKDQFKKTSQSKEAYVELRSYFLAAEPSLAWRTGAHASWREFLDECEVEVAAGSRRKT